MEAEKIRKTVRERYAGIAKREGSCCGPAPAACGGDPAEAVSRTVGYSKEEIDSVPEGANLGLGCGNPTALAAIRPGETVLDLGSGGGFDCFLAAKEAGPQGRVIGVDMTPEMIEKARGNALRGGYRNVEFRLGEIENLPVPDRSVDLVVSNCVVNLSTDKRRVFAEAFRALRPGGRMLISDLVLNRPLPEAIRESASAYAGCVAGALPKEEYLEAIRSAGFAEVEVAEETLVPVSGFAADPFVKGLIEEAGLSQEAIGALDATVSSIRVRGRKPEEPGMGERAAELDLRTKELIAIGASVAAHCQPCLKFHVDKIREVGGEPREIAEAIEVGKMVGKGAAFNMRQFAAQWTAGDLRKPSARTGCGCGS